MKIVIRFVILELYITKARNSCGLYVVCPKHNDVKQITEI